ncbi:hypothetical protein chiPu_0031362 [Chiloscyllium punctatum]|uniref:Uncharacterized protein n=1 Tax=Chiloscyllium punctatum TaxID=137246 RepID=A0A401TWK9_CHIPU|nr:hypothetical protein [Chiloscyllium punctatum]
MLRATEGRAGNCARCSERPRGERGTGHGAPSDRGESGELGTLLRVWGPTEGRPGTVLRVTEGRAGNWAWCSE